MRLRNIPGADEYISNSDIVINNPEDYKGSWNTDVFSNTYPIHIEIGMGKGRFLTTLAKENPHINYIGMDRYASVLIKAVKKLEDNPLNNLKLICADAGMLIDYFDKGEVEKIYLNFSDPWPKDRHAKRRLTSPNFLNIYHEFITENGLLEFKTDNTPLFDYSLSTIDESPLWEMCDYTYDLHNNPKLNEGNVMTEYEAKFSDEGNHIHKLIARSIIKY